MRRPQMPSRACRLPLLLLFFVTAARALEVTPNSPCASLCLNDNQANPNNGNNSWTIATDTVCDDWELAGPTSTIKGRKWKDCLGCEKDSTATDAESNENEVYWFLFNMKFDFDWCVFGYPNNPDIIPANQKCAEVCAGPDNSAKISLTDRLLQTNATLQYLYCNGPDIQNILDDCAACLDTVPNAKALGNYAKALKTACVQKPALGKTVKLDFDLFPPAATPISSSTPVRTQTETQIITQTSAPLSTLPSLAASSASAAASSQASHDKNVRVGVGVGVGVGALLAIMAVACCILMRRRSTRQKNISEEEMRARWEREYQAGLEQKSGTSHHPPSELEHATGGLVEADDGRPTQMPMLENRIARGSPGTFSSSGGGGGGGGLSSSGGGGGGGDTSWNSTPRGSRASRSGISRFLGSKPAVPAKD